MSENDLRRQAGDTAAVEDGVAASTALHPGDGGEAERWAVPLRHFIALSQCTDDRNVLRVMFRDPITQNHREAITGAINTVLLRARSQIEEPALAGDEVSAASNSASLTPPNQDFEAKARAIVERASNQPVELITAISSALLTASKDATERAARIADGIASIHSDPVRIDTADTIASAIRTQES